MQCKKITFNTRKDARAFIRRRGANKRLSTYKCPYCLYFHNTSEDSEHKRTSREINERTREDN